MTEKQREIAARVIQRWWRAGRARHNQRSQQHISKVQMKREHFLSKAQRYDDLRADELASYTFQLHRFLRFPLSRVSDPRMYLGITNELFGIIVAVCWILTATITPSMLTSNPLLEAWGYNNICVGFDALPMRYMCLPAHLPILTSLPTPLMARPTARPHETLLRHVRFTQCGGWLDCHLRIHFRIRACGLRAAPLGEAA